ncbi:hypothetical protein CAPTEDRAFT_194781 [Capitella teleta]|uniref:Uncharacterized protein n=1 Tax=Capitella teleta TaxID=283909 RepID=R7TTL2_CAPTE|nr:hypothetical protein CAPTEDRAFT_194781 [Capitella teleta]|eukprot:ELT96952.1 hypothetical protein CAPTEDRAFT_194781 [Capitella teleta]
MSVGSLSPNNDAVRKNMFMSKFGIHLVDEKKYHFFMFGRFTCLERVYQPLHGIKIKMSKATKKLQEMGHDLFEWLRETTSLELPAADSLHCQATRCQNPITDLPTPCCCINHLPTPSLYLMIGTQGMLSSSSAGWWQRFEFYGGGPFVVSQMYMFIEGVARATIITSRICQGSLYNRCVCIRIGLKCSYIKEHKVHHSGLSSDLDCVGAATYALPMLFSEYNWLSRAMQATLFPGKIQGSVNRAGVCWLPVYEGKDFDSGPFVVLPFGGKLHESTPGR